MFEESENDDLDENRPIIETDLSSKDDVEIKKCASKKIVTFSETEKNTNIDYKAMVVNKSETVKRFFAMVLRKLMMKMRKLSKNYSFIIKTMAHEKRMLMESLTPAQSESCHTMQVCELNFHS